MKLSGRTDIQAPVEFVFDAISDFDFWERAALRRGAEVTRTDKLRQPAPGMSWMIPSTSTPTGRTGSSSC